MKRTKAVILIALLVLGGLVAVTVFNKEPENKTDASIPAPQELPKLIPLNEDKLFELTNKERTDRGVKPLVRDPSVDAAAMKRAEDMIRRGYYSHYDPITGENLVRPNPSCTLTSENIQDYRRPMEFDTNPSVILNFMNSPAHREAILDPRYDSIGIAVHDGIVVQHFCDI